MRLGGLLRARRRRVQGIGYDWIMTVETIKDLIGHLQPDEQATLASWLWDSQIERDFSAGGDGLALLAEIDAAIGAGDVDGFMVTHLG